MPAPANDNFASAITISGLSGSITPLSLDDATTQGSEPQSTAYAGLGPHQTVWYKWTAPSSIDVVLAPTYPNASVTAVWTGASLAALTEVASIDSGSSVVGTLEFSAVSGTVYYIQAGTFGGESSANMYGLAHSTNTGSIKVAVDPYSAIFADPVNEIRVDTTAGVSIQHITIHRGRPDEREKTGTGTATITGRDTSGALDPTLGSVIVRPTAQASVSLRNPVSGVRKNLFVGYVADLDVDVDTSEVFNDFDLSLVDALDILADAEVIPDVAGNTVPSESTGDVYYDGADVDDRIFAALADAALSAGVTEWPADRMEIFSGNVAVQGTVYSPRTSILQVIQDAADAEFPGVANFYASKDGVVTFHGRFARFHPDVVDYNIQTWKVGDVAAFNFDPTNAVASKVSLTYGTTNLINAALATPTGIKDADIAGQFVSDSGSITSYGARSISFENLITEGGLAFNIDDANAETKLFADYYVDNFASPDVRVKQIVIRPPGGAAWAAATWDLICGVEISDLVSLTTTHPGGGGFFADFFVEGITYDIDFEGGSSFTNLTLTLDVSPRTLYDTNPFPE